MIATGSVTRAAQSLGFRSHPSAKHCVCEDQLGFKLFRRLEGKLSPTLETSVLYPEIDRVFGSGCRSSTNFAYELRPQRIPVRSALPPYCGPPVSLAIRPGAVHFGALYHPHAQGTPGKFYPPQNASPCV